MTALKMDGERLCAHVELEESVQQELIQALRNIADEWRRVLDLAQQLKAKAELQQTLLKELEALQDEKKNTRSWVDEQMQKLDFLDQGAPKQEKHKKLEVGSKPEIGGLLKMLDISGRSEYLLCILFRRS